MVENTVRILGVGPGLFILGFIWAFALLSVILSCKANGQLRSGGGVSLIVACVITAIVLKIPQQGINRKSSEVTSKLLVDQLFVWRTFVLVFLGASFIAGLALVFTIYFMEPVVAKPLNRSTIRIISLPK